MKSTNRNQNRTLCQNLSGELFSAVLAVLFLLFSGNVLLAQQVDRSAPPKLGPPPILHLPAIQRFQLANGLPVVLMEKHQVPLVQINVLIKAGIVNEPPGQNGLASMTAEMLDEGAGRRDALQLADAIDFLGAQISTSAGYHNSVVSLHTPAARLDSALRLLSDVVRRPTFPQKELNRLRKERLTALLQLHDRPTGIASVLFNRILYGRKHPYGRIRLGNEKSLRKFTVADLREFYRRNFVSNNAAIIVVGDVTWEEILPRLEKAFGNWASGRPAALKLPAVSQVKKERIYLVDKPGAAQSVIRIGRIGVSRKTADYYPLVVMNTLLGGSFTSRLNQNLREEHGYSYGAGSSFSFRPLPGPFLAGASVQTDVTDKALAEFMKELNNIRKPINDEELTRAKNYVALRFPRRFQTVRGIAAQLQDLVAFDLPEDYFNNYIPKILAVTRADVEQVARKYIVPDKMAIVVVGDRGKIGRGIRALHLAPVKFLKIDDVLGKIPRKK